MEIAIETFLIFSCLMFWIVFYNKKGLLSEIKNTEKKISAKIIVLEDLLDKTSLSTKNDEQDSEDSSDLLDISSLATKEQDGQTQINKNDPAEIVLPLIDENLQQTYENNTEYRFLKLNEVLIEDNNEIKKFNLSENRDVNKRNSSDKNNPKDDVADLSPESFANISFINESEDMDQHEQPFDAAGVRNIVMEAKENLLKIDVSDVQEIRTFKDVVLMSKKLESKEKAI